MDELSEGSCEKVERERERERERDGQNRRQWEIIWRREIERVRERGRVG